MNSDTRMNPHADRYALAWIVFGFFAAMAVVVSTGCVVPAKVREQLVIDSAAADRVTVLWPTLSPERREVHYQDLRTGVWVTRYALFGELPEDEALKTKILSMGDE